MDKRQLLRYIGDCNQLFGIKEYTLSDGKAKGVKAFDVRNGSGLEFTVLADRCLDISSLAFKSLNCSYLSKTGMIAPEYYEASGTGFLRNFFAGFLTTCGLRNVGNACEVDGEPLSMHGRISNIPGEEICASTDWVDGVPVMTISGKMREARMFGENLVLKRKIICRYGENAISIQNCVENLGFTREPLMLLFHFNLGYPLLDEEAMLVTPTGTLLPRDAEASKGSSSYHHMQPPTPSYREQVFYHNLLADNNGDTCVALINHRIELGLAISFNKKQLFNFTQWKQMGEGEYVLGMEPCNCYVGGRLDPLNNSVLEYLEPGESKNFDIRVELVNGKDHLTALEEKINSFKTN